MRITKLVKACAKKGLSLFCALTMLTPLAASTFVYTFAAENIDTSGVEVNQTPMQTVYDYPATDWESESLPLGNGYLGASVFGGVNSEEILINEHTLWSGGPGADANYDGGMADNTSTETKKSSLKTVREELAAVMAQFSENYNPGVGASNTSNYPNLSSTLNSYIENLKGEKDNFGSYQELGRIKIDDVSTSNMIAYASGCLDTNVSALFDGVKSGGNDGKWFSANGGEWLDESIDTYPLDVNIRYFEPKAVRGYTITLGNDSARMNRVPDSWTFYGSNDGKEWVSLHHVEKPGFNSASASETTWQSKTYTLDAEVSYTYYKLTIEANNGGWGTELGEFELHTSKDLGINDNENKPEEIGTFVTAYGENCYATAFGSPTPSNNGLVSNLFDNNTGTRWYSADGSPSGTTFASSDDLIIKYSAKYPISGYSMTTAVDSYKWGRDPIHWNIYGSNDDGATWTLIEEYNPGTRTFTGEYQKIDFTLKAVASYSAYKFEFVDINAVDGHQVGAGVQLSEFSLTPYVPEDQKPIELVNAYAEGCVNTDYNANVTCSIPKLFDGIIEEKNNKWFSADGADWGVLFEAPDSLILEYSAPLTIDSYMMALGNDNVATGRSPESWKLYGSTDGKSWVEIQYIQDSAFASIDEGTDRYEQKTFTLDAPVTYKWYKFEFLAITGNTKTPQLGAGVQIGELRLNQTDAPVEEKPEEGKFVTAYGENCYANTYTHDTYDNARISNLFDNNTGTKWYSADGSPAGTVFETPDILIIEYSAPYAISGYSMTTANDSVKWGRDPAKWNLYGSNDGGATWTLIEEYAPSGRTFSSEYQKIDFTLSAPATYTLYKFEFVALYGGTVNAVGVQLSELSLTPYDPNAPVAPETPNENQNQNTNVAPTDYQRSLDIDNATASVSYNKGDVSYNREYFVSNPGNFIGGLLTSTGGVMNKIIYFTTPQVKATITAEGDTITITGWPADHDQEEKLLFAAQIKVITDGEIITMSNMLYIANATRIEFYMTAGTNYQQCMDDSYDYFSDEDPLDAVKARIAALSGKSYEELKAAHIKDYKELYDRVKIDLGGMEQPTKNTDALLAGYKNNTNTAAENRYLEALYYQYGRYLLIASSRDGSLPANLQGIWGEGLDMPWDADYHANINVQMNYWLAQTTNLAECHQPYIDYVNSLVARGHITANTYHYNVNDESEEVRGWTTYHENNIWGNTAPGNWQQSFYFPVAGAWLALDIWEQYAFTMDKELLAESYDTLKGAALFWVDNLVVDPRDGTLVNSPSYSPEHGPFSLGASCDQTIIWEVFNSTLQAAAVVGDNSLEIEEIRTAMSKLSVPKIGVNGQYMEWKDEITLDVTGDNQHRHVNHLFAIYPGTLVVDDESELNSAYVEAIMQTLDTRGDGGPGWGKAWKMGIWARMHEADRAGHLASEVLKQDTYPNLFDKYMPTDLFQIDGNFGTTASMTEMFLQSHADYIDIFPALPEMWYGASVSGLCARGNVEVDIQSAKDGSLEKAVLRVGTSNNALQIRTSGLAGYVVADSKGNLVPVTRISSDVLSFAAEAGETYTVVKGTSVDSITLDKSELHLEVGETAQLTAIVEPSDATNADVAWISSDVKVATVVNGVVTAVGKGTATITAQSYDGNASASCSVTVTWDTHVHTETIIEGYDPSCTSTGLSDGKKCNVCGETLLEQEIIPATGHTEVIDEGKDSTCTEGGLSEGKHCGVCGEVLVEQTPTGVLGHNWLDATCAAPKTCSRCGITEGEPHGVHDDVVEIVDPTCTEGGYKKITCTVCGDTVISDQKPPLGHDWTEVTTEAPKTCERCGETEGDPLPKPVDPTPGDPTTPATDNEHENCQGNWLTELINAIINFFRKLFGLPEKCICGEEL